MEADQPARELLWRRTYPGTPENARPARDFVAYLLADLPQLDDAILVTAEFIANALTHTASAHPGGHFHLEVRRHPQTATIALTDQGTPTEPTLKTPTPEAESGRGLQTVQALATTWHYTGTPTSRTFTATFDHPT